MLQRRKVATSRSSSTVRVANLTDELPPFFLRKPAKSVNSLFVAAFPAEAEAEAADESAMDEIN